jgi:Kef-type K+ transport system membrane component KefB
MSEIAILLITLGAVFLLGVVADLIGKKTIIPRVSLLILLGLLLGPNVLDLLPELQPHWVVGITDFALVMLGFLIGGTLTRASFLQHGRAIMVGSLVITISTATIMFLGISLLNESLVVALVLAATACATDPAATRDVIRTSRVESPLSGVLLGVVAIDDAWGLILFSVFLILAQGLTNNHFDSLILLHGLWEIGGALLLGTALGFPMAYLTGRIEPGEPTLIEALGWVLLCGGMAVWLDVSMILSSMTLGVIVVNFARHHNRPFHAIEGIEWPFLMLFFVLTGASLNLQSISHVGGLLIAYILLRTGSRVLSGWLGARLAGMPQYTRPRVGWALLPQAGVAIGMTLVAVQKFPELQDRLLPVVVVSTLIFEIVGPIATRMALSDPAMDAK